jgi:hypothetical protein
LYFLGIDRIARRLWSCSRLLPRLKSAITEDSGKAVLKKFVRKRLCMPLAVMAAYAIPAHAQFSPVPLGQIPPSAMPAQAPSVPVPDEVHLNIMARNALIALNQANATGNYSVLRDMGTPNFQMSNSSARLAEIFATLRSKRVDLSPVLFYSPKFNSPPTVQDGQILRLSGYFPTAPEVVNFDLAFQYVNDQWMLAGIAVSIAPPTEAQAAAPAIQSGQMTAENAGKPQSVRIDLSKPPPASGTPAKKPQKKAKTQTQQHAADPQSSPQNPAQKTVQPAPKDDTGSTNWNPFPR